MRLPARRMGNTAQVGDHGEIFDTGEVVVEIGLFRDVAHAAFVGDEVVVDGFAIEENPAGGHLDEAGDHFHGRGLAGAIGSEVAGDFSGTCGEGDVIDGGNSGEVFGDALQFEHSRDPEEPISERGGRAATQS